MGQCVSDYIGRLDLSEDQRLACNAVATWLTAYQLHGAGHDAHTHACAALDAAQAAGVPASILSRATAPTDA